MSDPQYTISEDGLSITCLICGMTSHNLNDVAHKYCGRCHVFLDLLYPEQIETLKKLLQLERESNGGQDENPVV
jgi:hypothetical protein